MKPKLAIILLLLSVVSAFAFLLIDDTHDQTVGGTKTHVIPIMGSEMCADLHVPPTNGEVQYCSDCIMPSSPCTAGGTGAMAAYINGRWECFPGGNAVVATATPVPTATPGSGTCPGAGANEFQYNSSGACAGTGVMTWDSAISGWTLTGGTLPVDGSKDWVHETGTFTGTGANTPTPAVGQLGNLWNITGAGSGNYQIANQMFLGAGYTGKANAISLRVNNNSAVTISATPTPVPLNSASGMPGAIGLDSNMVATATGEMTGVNADVQNAGAGDAIGVFGKAVTSHTGRNIGLLGNGNQDGGPGYGVYGVLSGSSAAPTLYSTTNAAVIGDVWTTNGAIFLGLEHGVEVFRASRSTGSAINGVNFSSANTGNEPSMNATSNGGSPDTNVSYDINALGTGAVKVKHPGGGGSPFTAGAITCGGGPADLHGTDSAFQMTMGTSPGSCSFSFKSTWNSAPACVCTNQTTPGNTVAIQATTTLATVVGTKVTSDVINCICNSWTD